MISTTTSTGNETSENKTTLRDDSFSISIYHTTAPIEGGEIDTESTVEDSVEIYAVCKHSKYACISGSTPTGF